MARRYGGKYSPDGDKSAAQSASVPRDMIRVDPVGARANLMFLPAVVLVFASLFNGALGLATGVAGAGVLCLGAWLLRGGLQAEAEWHARKVARRPAVPRKILSALLAGAGTGLGALSHGSGFVAAGLLGCVVTGLHVAAFGTDPMRDKGMEGIDTFQQDRVARVVDEAEDHLAAMKDAIRRAADRETTERVEAFQATARRLIRTVEEDPRDLTAARKYLGVYLMGARDATIKFADIYSRSRDAQAKTDYLVLLGDLERNFTARTEKLLLDDQSDLMVEIEVLRDRLKQEGVRTD